jgi:archaeosine-15-forming tRNA-guanine transglycosylase
VEEYVLKEVHNVLCGVNLVMYMSISIVLLYMFGRDISKSMLKAEVCLNGGSTGEIHDQGDNDKK